MTLPPLWNLLAVHEPNPSILEATRRSLQAAGEFGEIWNPAPEWLVAIAALPGTGPLPPEVRENGLVFVEGLDVVFERLEGDIVDRTRRLAIGTDQSPERLGSVQGDFGFLRFREDGGVTVVRSCGGLVPLYVHRSTSRLAVATRLSDLTRYLPEQPDLDPLPCAVWTTGQAYFPDQRTFLRDTSILERGHFAVIQHSHMIRVGRYWDPRPPSLCQPTARRILDHTERLRTALLRRLERELDPADPNLLTLSGGVDSSSLAALAAGPLERKVATLTFLPLASDMEEHERSYLRSLRSSCFLSNSWEIPLSREARFELLKAVPRVVFLVSHPALGALPAIQRELPVRVLFGGEFADDLCGSRFTFPDWEKATSPARLLASLRKLPFGKRDLLRWARLRLRASAGLPELPFPSQLPRFVRQELGEEYLEWLDRRRREASADRRPWAYLDRRMESTNFIAMNWEVASSLGIRRSFPFLNREIIDLAFECHPAELVGPGTKRILRQALRHDVPAWNLEREDKGYWTSDLDGADCAWGRRLHQSLAPIVRDDWYSTPPERIPYWCAFHLEALMILARNREEVGAERILGRFTGITARTFDDGGR